MTPTEDATAERGPRYRARRGARALAALVLGTCLAANEAGAGEQGAELVELMRRVDSAGQQLDYRGTLVFSSPAGVESLEVLHGVRHGRSVTRLTSLTGNRRTVYVTAESVVCLLNDEGTQVVSSKQRTADATRLFASLLEMPELVDTVRRHYRLARLPPERAAGRMARVYKLTPADAYRYGYQLYVDEAENLLLGYEVLSPRGMVLEAFRYASIEIGGVDTSSLEVPTRAGDLSLKHTFMDQGMHADAAWMPSWLPSGFELNGRGRDRMGEGGEPVEHILYSDGLGSLSVFIERLPENAMPMTGLSSMGGAVNAYGCMREPRYQVTVVGEVPGATVERVCESVLPAG